MHVLHLASEFREYSTLLAGLKDTNIPDDKISLLASDAITARAKSVASTKNVVRHVITLLKYYLELLDDTTATLAGESSVVLIHGYLEELAERGRTVPASAKHALTVWAEAIGIEWPLANPLVISASVVETNETPKQAPAMEPDTLRKIERLSTNTEVGKYKRSFGAGILLMTYTSLRFSDVQRLASFDANEDSINGTLQASETKKPNGLNWPWACPRTGITGGRDWVKPILDLRAAYAKVNGHQTHYTFPRLDYKWDLVAEGPSPYSTTRRKLALLSTGLGDEAGEAYTLHSPKNLLPTAANQMRFDQRELTIIGR